MSDYTTVSPVTVTAHRRRTGSGSGSFPHSSSGGVPMGRTIVLLRDDGNYPDENTTVSSPCDDPIQRRELNTDAAAAEARRQMIQKSQELGDRYPFSREFGAVLFRQADGSIGVGPISYGEHGTGGVVISFDGLEMRDVLGTIHNHPGGTNSPSAIDQGIFNDLLNAVGQAGGDRSAVRQYVIGLDSPPDGGDPRHSIFIYDETNQNEKRGPEVDPNGLPCPL